MTEKNFYDYLEDTRSWLTRVPEIGQGFREEMNRRLDYLGDRASEMSDWSHDFGWDSAMEHSIELLRENWEEFREKGGTDDE